MAFGCNRVAACKGPLVIVSALRPRFRLRFSRRLDGLTGGHPGFAPVRNGLRLSLGLR